MARNAVSIEEGRRLLARQRKEGQKARLHAKVREALKDLPEPVTELTFHPTRKWRFDYAWPEYGVALEVHGGIWSGGRHTRGTGFINDREKMNEAQLLGWTVIEVAPKHVDDGSAERWVKEALAL